MKIDALPTDQTTDQMVIEAERLTLRPVEESDAGLLEMYAGDERVARMTRSIPHPMPPGAAEAFIRAARAENRREDIWIIDGRVSDRDAMLGVINLERLDRNQSEIGYWVAPAFWNTGFATEAVRALIAANPHGSKQIFAEVFQDNPVSARVLTNCGFEYLGDAEDFSIARGGKVPSWTYCLQTGA